MSFVQAVLINTSKSPVIYSVPTENYERDPKMANPQLEILSDQTLNQTVRFSIQKIVVLAPGCYSRQLLELEDKVPFQATALVLIDGKVHSLQFSKASQERVYVIHEGRILERKSFSTFISFPTQEEIESFKAKISHENEDEALSDNHIRKRVANQLGKKQLINLYRKNPQKFS